VYAFVYLRKRVRAMVFWDVVEKRKEGKAVEKRDV
jgi:hypothetical protein